MLRLSVFAYFALYDVTDGVYCPCQQQQQQQQQAAGDGAAGEKSLPKAAQTGRAAAETPVKASAEAVTKPAGGQAGKAASGESAVTPAAGGPPPDKPTGDKSKAELKAERRAKQVGDWALQGQVTAACI